MEDLSREIQESGWPEIESLMQSCQDCSLFEEATQAVPGLQLSNSVSIMFVGEGPGFNEDKTGRPFVGRAGVLLQELLIELDAVKLGVYITNVVKHRPPNNRKPTVQEMSICGTKFLAEEVKLCEPKVIVCLGRTPAEYLLRASELEHSGSLRGHNFVYNNTPVICTWHPAYILRQMNRYQELKDDIVRAIDIVL
jgi:DNA polymerase